MGSPHPYRPLRSHWYHLSPLHTLSEYVYFRCYEQHVTRILLFQILAERLDGLERAIPVGRDGLFQLASCVYKVTGTDIMPGLSQGTYAPRQIDHEGMALVVAAYRVLDAYIFTTQSLPPAPSTSMLPRNSSFPQIKGPHVVEDWVEVAQSFSTLMRSGEAATTELDIRIDSPPSTGHSLALLKKLVQSRRNAAIWRVFSNIYACATFLVCLCEPARVEASPGLFYRSSSTDFCLGTVHSHKHSEVLSRLV